MTGPNIAWTRWLLGAALGASACRGAGEREHLSQPSSVVLPSSPRRADLPKASSAKPATPMANMQHPPTVSDLSSFSSAYGSSLLNSHVPVTRRRYEGWIRRSITYRKPVPDLGERRPPLSLVVSADGRHGALVSRNQSDVVDADGSGWMSDPDDVTALVAQVFVGGTAMSWEGELLPRENTDRVSTLALVRRIGAERFCAVWKFPDHLGGKPQLPAVVFQGGLRARQPFAGWYKKMPGHGVAAIAEDFTGFLAMDSRRLKVVAPRGDDQGMAMIEGDYDVGMVAERISLIGSQVLLLAAEGGGTRIRAFTKKGAAIYSLTVPFAVSQPAVAGADKRVYLAGKGLAAIDEGKVIWKHDSEEQLYVSSFEDGSLAVANGKRLDFMKLDGTVEQSFEAQEPLVAPPAIAGDGSVWAASATALYIAR
jgi:hypothetical protein